MMEGKEEGRGNLQVVGKMMTSQTRESMDGSCCRPTISVLMGPMVSLCVSLGMSNEKRGCGDLRPKKHREGHR